MIAYCDCIAIAEVHDIMLVCTHTHAIKINKHIIHNYSALGKYFIHNVSKAVLQASLASLVIKMKGQKTITNHVVIHVQYIYTQVDGNATDISEFPHQRFTLFQ